VRELWARALYRLEDLREPVRLAQAGFWLAVLWLYALVQWSVPAPEGIAASGPGAIAREVCAIGLLLPLVFRLAKRVPLSGPLPLLVHGLASLGFALLVGAAALGGALRADTLAAKLAGPIGVYAFLLVVRWTYGRLCGAEPEQAEQLSLDLVRAPAGGAGHRERFVVRRRGREVIVPAREVNWIQAAGREVVLHLGRESYRLRESMQAVEQSLDPRSFVRVHRSRIVNLDRIREIYPWAYGDFRIVMQDGTVVNFSRVYRSRLEEMTG
jgi:hypothetical protein